MLSHSFTFTSLAIRRKSGALPPPSDGSGIFGFPKPETPPTSFPGTMLTKAEAEAADASNWNFRDRSFSIVDGQLISTGDATKTRGAGPVSQSSAQIGDRVAVLCDVVSSNGNGLANLFPESVNSRFHADVGWRTSCSVLSQNGPVHPEWATLRGVTSRVESIHAINITELLAQKWFIVSVISEENWIGNASTERDRALDTPAWGCVSFEPLGYRNTGAELDENGLALPRIPVEPVQGQSFNTGGGPHSAFLRELRQHIPEDYTIVYLPAGHVGGRFSGEFAVWNPESASGGQAYNGFWVQLRALWAAAPNGSVMGGVVFCQGESDIGNTQRSTWRDFVPRFLQEVRDEPGYGDVPVIISEVGGDPNNDPEVAAMIALQKELASGSGSPLEMTRCAYVPRPPGASFESDGRHFDQPTNRMRGVGVAQALRDLIYP